MAVSQFNMKFLYTTREKMKSLPISNGQVIFCHDIHAIYFDFEDVRKQYGEITILKSNDNRFDEEPSDKSFYYIEDDRTLWFYNSGAWIQISQEPTDIVVDSSLTLAGMAADSKIVGDALKEKVSVVQSVDDAGKVLTVNEEGNVIPMDGAKPVTVIYEEETKKIIIQELKSNLTIAVDSTLTSSGYAADAKVTGEKIDQLSTENVEQNAEISRIGNKLVCSDTEPETEETEIWVDTSNSDENSFIVPEIKDNEVNGSDTWSSEKINNEIKIVSDGVTQLNGDLVKKIDNPTSADNNKFPRAKNGNVEWVEHGLPTDEQTESAVTNWLNAHPEATTTVQDDSLTYKKFVKGTLGYVTPEMFGAVGDGVSDDTNAINISLRSGFSVHFCNKTYLISDTIKIPSNTKLRLFNSEVKSTREIPIFSIASNSNSVFIDGGFLNGNNVSNVGIEINKNCSNISINNVTIYNIKSETSFAYGIAIPCFSCNDVVVKNCIINNVSSLGNGTIGDKQGWSKGIIIGFDGWLNDELPSVIDDSTYSKNIVIRNNSIKNIQYAEDGDGIYIEGITGATLNPMLFELDVVVDGNYLENCGKRFIKVIPCGGAIIRNNMCVITEQYTQTEQLHSFISIYAPSAIVENNTFNCKKNYALYGIDFGIQTRFGEYIGGLLLIEGNKIINKNDRKNDVTAALYYTNYGGVYKLVKIINNYIECDYYGLYTQNGFSNMCDFDISNNDFIGLNAFRCIQIEKGVKNISLNLNTIRDGFSNSPIYIASANVVNIIGNMINAELKSVVNCYIATIKDNYIFNTAITRRFELTTSGWNYSSNNNDSAGGNTSW